MSASQRKVGICSQFLQMLTLSVPFEAAGFAKHMLLISSCQASISAHVVEHVGVEPINNYWLLGLRCDKQQEEGQSLFMDLCFYETSG